MPNSDYPKPAGKIELVLNQYIHRTLQQMADEHGHALEQEILMILAERLSLDEHGDWLRSQDG